MPRPRYPTIRQVMSSPVDFKVATLAAMHEWKKRCLKTYRSALLNDKLHLLADLCEDLTEVYEKKVTVVLGDKYCYQPDTETLMLDRNHASIISTLHEFGHHLYGHSELMACRWSIWLYKTVFPKTWETLEFRESPYGLLLVNKPVAHQPSQGITN